MIPVHLVTGFLGAGKTSFLNRLLRDPALGETLVVVNEFGDAALDHRLYERLDGDVALLASGCLCCALRGDFVESQVDRRLVPVRHPQPPAASVSASVVTSAPSYQATIRPRAMTAARSATYTTSS